MLSRLVNLVRTKSPSSFTYQPITTGTRRSSDPHDTVILTSTTSSLEVIDLNGLRGLAALAVTSHTFLHSINPDWDIGYGFGIPLFCVLVGQSLSYSLVPHFLIQSWDDLLGVISSLFFNRSLRIFLPAICATFFALIMLRLNLYDFALATTYEQPTTTRQPELSAQLVDWWKSALLLIYPLYGARPHLAYIPALWVLPVLFRDLMICTLVIIAVARCRRAIRWTAIGYLLWQAYQNDQLNRFSMLGGVLLADIDTGLGQDLKLMSRGRRPIIMKKMLNIMLLVVSTFLMARPRYCSNGLDKTAATCNPKDESWHHVGAVLALYSVSKFSVMKRILLGAPLHYTGRLSYAIYLLQSSLIQVVGYRVLAKIVGRGPIVLSPGTSLGLLVSLILTLIVILSLSHIFWHVVEIPVQSFATWFETRCLSDIASIQTAPQEAERFPRASRTESETNIFSEPRYRGLGKCLRRIGRFMVPSWVQDWVSQGPSEPPSIHPTAYLDGLRGWASLFVLIYHSTYDYHPKRSQGYGVDPKHSHFIQLPILRVLYSGPNMVWVFYAISGFALSLKPLQYIQHGQMDKLLLAISSSVFRRMVRLYLPVLTVTFIAMLGVQAGAFREETYITTPPDFARDYKKPGAIPHYADVFSQLHDWLRQMESQMRMASSSPKRNSYNPHSWTIPVEFDGSMVVFAVLLTLAKARTWMRISSTAALVIYLWYIRRGVAVQLFLAGVLLAEVYVQQQLQKPWTQLVVGSVAARPLSWLAFVSALFLISMPWVHGADTPGYRTLTHFASDATWRELGVPLLILSVQLNRTLQWLFTTPVSRYLGRISFALYLCQFLVIYTLGKALIPVCLELTGQQTLWRFELGFWLGNSVVVVVTFWLADVFWRAVDLPSVSFARWLEERSMVTVS
ncbi:hard surface induced protein 3-like protein [Phlyctema vagabunda]|uniref:Hard surface induced protein 3-like protein n=1 Tax=Phlyctema vagabunda TaxID=108571 RepID=A0ABR4PYF1_9HELO